MKVIIKNRVDGEYIKEKADELVEKYGSLDSLGQKASIGKCASPSTVDDYELLKALLKGAEMEEETVFHDYSIFSVLGETRVEILDYLQKNRASSIKELASALSRDYKNMYYDLTVMQKMELVSITKKGRKRVPVSRVKKIEILFD
jgi:hypothetical protein